MNTGLWFAFAAIAAGAGFFFLKKNKKFIDISKVHKETLEGCLDYEDVISWFKNLQLKKDEDIPFIAQSFDNLFDQQVKGQEILVKEGYITILLGIYNEVSKGLIDSKILFVKDLDGKLKDLLGKESCIVLS
jgi:hypothetical protein